MKLGEHIMLLRKSKSLSQSALGKIIDTSGDILGRYERNLISPSIDVTVKLADALEVSLDYLVGKTKMVIDNQALKRLEDISQLDQTDKEHLFATIDAFLRDAKTRDAYK